MIGRLRSHDDVDVRVTGGVVRGVRERGLLAWRGIPYAAAPVGPFGVRFSPAPADPWDGVRDASGFGPIAPQSLRNLLGSSAHRGVIAAWERGLPDGERVCVIQFGDDHDPTPRPVMVFIHGGGYLRGVVAATSRQRRVLRSKMAWVIYVSFNYRLGALGYLDFSRYSTAERSFVSNLGLRDQLALLQWVRNNISAFGGDPENVTVFGASFGGNAVTTLMATPSARGLFVEGHRAEPADQCCLHPGPHLASGRRST